MDHGLTVTQQVLLLELLRILPRASFPSLVWQNTWEPGLVGWTIDAWTDIQNIIFNDTNGTLSKYRPGEVGGYAGCDGSASVVRWTSPAGGWATIWCDFGRGAFDNTNDGPNDY